MQLDLSTSYLGLKLKNPLIASASPLTGHLDKLMLLESEGAAAVVLPSLFEEQIEQQDFSLPSPPGADPFQRSALTPVPPLVDYNTGPDGYLKFLEQAKKAVAIPVVASLNGTSRGPWLRFAKSLEDAGADAIELNIYLVSADPEVSGAEIEERYVELVAAAREAISIPLAVKIGPFFTSPAHVARRLAESGADGLVLFNRFCQPDINVEWPAVCTQLELSSPAEARLPLRWIAILREKVSASLAATTGVHSAEDVIKYLLAGADAVMTASALLRHGPRRLAEMLDGLRAWMIEKKFARIDDFRGSLCQLRVPDPSAFERAHYLWAVTTYETEPARAV
ncbi:MAG: dihydroorotate dehydrogenase-like protein [Planctomycetia bacterium]|nr:dihydroorotate dehydrogenase-like protein [Planctomycetia bacterium]